jgi:hypothetical protein
MSSSTRASMAVEIPPVRADIPKKRAAQHPASAAARLMSELAR